MVRSVGPQLDTTLGSLVVDHPRAAAVLERLDLDYCCGGALTLTEACRARGFDPTIVRALLIDSIDQESHRAAAAHDVADTSIAELCDHIVVSHHQPLRRELGRISELLAKVVRAHGEQDPSVHQLQRLFSDTRSELEAHMATEEAELFVACRAFESDDAATILDDHLLAQLEDTHAATGEALRELRELGGGYRPERAHCTTHRVLLEALRDFELDLHRHVHEENNILFGKVRERMTSA